MMSKMSALFFLNRLSFGLRRNLQTWTVWSHFASMGTDVKLWASWMSWKPKNQVDECNHKSNLPQLKLKPKNINQICHNWSWYAFWPFNKLRKAEVRAHVADLPSVLKIGHAGYQILETSLHARVAHHYAPWQQQGSMGWWLILSKDHCHEFLLRSGWGPWFGAGVCELEHELLKFLDPKCHAPMCFLST